jgi:hypothetical protein
VTKRHLELGAALEDDEDQHCHQRAACRHCEKLVRDPRDHRPSEPRDHRPREPRDHRPSEPRDHRPREPRPPGHRACFVLLFLEILELLPAVRALPQMGFQQDPVRQANVPVEKRGETLVSILAIHGK